MLAEAGYRKVSMEGNIDVEARRISDFLVGVVDSPDRPVKLARRVAQILNLLMIPLDRSDRI